MAPSVGPGGAVTASAREGDRRPRTTSPRERLRERGCRIVFPPPGTGLGAERNSTVGELVETGRGGPELPSSPSTGNGPRWAGRAPRAAVVRRGAALKRGPGGVLLPSCSPPWRNRRRASSLHPASPGACAVTSRSPLPSLLSRLGRFTPGSFSPPTPVPVHRGREQPTGTGEHRRAGSVKLSAWRVPVSV